MEALKDVRILDMTHVQAGPTCSQLLAWMGADVIKFENPQGDATRGQLRDVPNADSLYFTMLNCNKRSITVNMKSAEGKAVFVDLLKKCDIIMEHFGPGVLDRFGSGREVGDWGTGPHLALGLLAALRQAERTGQGQYVEVAMMDGIMNLCRVKWRDHQRLTRGSLPEYSVATHRGMGGGPRAGNDSGGGQLGNAIRCKPGGTNDFIYVVVQEAVWDALARRIGPEVHMTELATDPKFAT